MANITTTAEEVTRAKYLRIVKKQNQVRWLYALENAAGINSHLTIRIYYAFRNSSVLQLP
jgi:hypothetical protein